MNSSSDHVNEFYHIVKPLYADRGFQQALRKEHSKYSFTLYKQFSAFLILSGILGLAASFNSSSILAIVLSSALVFYGTYSLFSLKASYQKQF